MNNMNPSSLNPSSPDPRRARFSTPKKLLLGLLIFMVLLAGAFAIYKLRSRPAQDPVTTSASSSSSSSSPDNSSAQVPPANQKPSSSEPSDDNPDGKTPEQYEGNNPNSGNELTGVISTARFSSSGDTLILRVNLDQYLSSGTCSLKISDGEGTTPVEKSVEIIPSASTSTCAGFDLPASDLEPFATPFTVEVFLSSGTKSGTLSTTFE